jgi:hypothetical protein
MVQLNSKNEVADFLDVNQFIPGRSAYECVAYSGALVKYCGSPGKGPTGSTLEASNLAQFWYGKEEGSNLASNTNGMSLQAEYDMLQGMELHYSALSSVQDIKDTLAQQGLPVLLCGAETGMYDMGLGDRVPYNWTPTGNHCIVVSGVDSAGHLLVHDCANVDVNGIVRPGPRTYDTSKISLVSATAVSPPWKGNAMVPAGWTDDGHTLRSPNNVPIVLGFRDYVLSHNWDKDNWALAPEAGMAKLEASNPALGGGDQQPFRTTLLGYTPERGVFEEWGIVELGYTRKQYAALFDAYQKLKAGQTQASPQLLADVHAATALLAKY